MSIMFAWRKKSNVGGGRIQYYEWERSKIEQVNALHLLSRWWWGRGESGCYKNKKPTVAADTNKNDGVEINEYHRDVDALDGMTYLCLLCPL